VEQELEIGAQLVGEPHLMSEEKMMSFERTIWVRAPNVHSDLAAAKQAGMSRKIASGQNVLAFLHRLLHVQFKDGWTRGGKIKARWVGSVFVGDVITAHATVEKISHEDGRKRVALAVWCVNQSGTKVAVGEAEACIL